MRLPKKPIEGFSRYTTDGVGVFLRTRLIRPRDSEYKLIPDDGDGVNIVPISEKDALRGNKKQHKPSTPRKSAKGKEAI